MEGGVEARIKRAGYRGGFVVRGVSFRVEPGELLLVTGRSGSGKSTLLKAVLGLLSLENGFVEGSVSVAGLDPYSVDPGKLYRYVAYLPQEPWSGVLGHVVWVDYCLALSSAGKECDAMRLGVYGLGDLVEQNTYVLSAGETQRLLWATGTDRGAAVFAMDEPLVYISRDGRGRLVDMAGKLVAEGASVLVVDHDPEPWSRLEPHVIVMRDGRPVYQGPYRDDLVEKPAVRRIEASVGDTVVEARDVWHWYPGRRVLRGVDFAARRGEVVGITGGNGAGKTTLLKILAGAMRPRRGRIRRHGSTMYVPEDPLLFFTHPTPRGEIEAYPGGVEAAAELGVEHLLDRPLARLSSGERRRAALAAAIAAGYDALFLDEPSGGLDTYSLEALASLIARAAEKGRCIVIASHDDRLEPLYTRRCVLERGVLRCS